VIGHRRDVRANKRSEIGNASFSLGEFIYDQKAARMSKGLEHRGAGAVVAL